MKKVLFISTIVLLSACSMKGEDDKPHDKDSTNAIVPNMDSVTAVIPTDTDTDSPSKDAIAKLEQDTAELGSSYRKLAGEKAQLMKDTARLGSANRQLVSENKLLVAEKSKTPTKSQGDDCASVRKENAALKKTNQTLSIRNAALQGENSKLTKQLTPKGVAGKDSNKQGKTKKSRKEEYKEIFDAVNGGKN